MAIGYVAEFSVLPRELRNQLMMLPHHPAIAQQEVDFTAGVTESAAFAAGVRYIRITSDTTARYLVGAAGGTDAEASNSNFLLAGTVEYLAVAEGNVISWFINA